MDNIIETRSLCYSYGEENAVDNLSLDFERGKVTSLLGANGAGKSTLFLMLNGILKPKSGEVFVNGKKAEYNKKGIRELRKNVGIVFQNPDDQLFSASVKQDISFGALNMGLSEAETEKRVQDAMEKMGITDLAERPVHALSYGQKKRAAIAGIIVMKPRVIILDEPTAGLDPMSVSRLMKLLTGICREEGITIIVSTHDIDAVPVFSDKIYAIRKGRLIIGGTPREVISNPELLRENALPLPRVSHLLEILNKKDNIDIDFSASTIGEARNQLLDHLDKRVR